MSSKIEWTEDTWNPLIGCDKISAGCKNCYAIKTAWIRQHNSKMAEKYAGVVEKTSNGSLNWTGKINFHQPSLLKPLNTKKPTMFFVNSMSDLFHEDVPFEYIDAIFSVMSDCDWHTYQVLTKRAKRLYEFYQWKREQFNIPWQPKNNVWIGVSVEDQKAADERIPYLLQIPAAVRFLSCEPLLGPVDLSKVPVGKAGFDYTMGDTIHWVIAGGESGKGARPMHPEWVRSIRNQCYDAEVPFFFKQWGEYREGARGDSNTSNWIMLGNNGQIFKGEETITRGLNATLMSKVGKKEAGRLLDRVEYNEFPTIKK